jgi:hypothetical protein
MSGRPEPVDRAHDVFGDVFRQRVRHSLRGLRLSRFPPAVERRRNGDDRTATDPRLD